MKLKTPEELDLTPGPFRNLCILTTEVRKKMPPPQFDIRFYNFNGALDQNGYLRSVRQLVKPFEAATKCGTSACFLGYGPLCGISAARSWSWGDYARCRFNAEVGSDLYCLLFQESHLNSKEAAVRRAAYFLAHGFPKEVYTCEYDTWEAPASFRAPWKLIEAAAKDQKCPPILATRT